mmetsp:Transcript_37743/g.70397  ORF Transcript_37743/g.70397 Transcript_37743/m.70397 type:complete len:406 (+) Transcript_37743:38-1255(+)
MAYPQAMAYRLEVRCNSTGVGDQLAVVGTGPELGDWDPSRAVRLETSASAFPIWAASVPAAILSSEFKFIILRSDGKVTWEETKNRWWKQRALGAAPGAVLSSSFEVDELQVRQPHAAPAAPSAQSGRAISFKATVSVSQVPHLGETDLKRELWWGQEDFADFLKVRVALANEYKEAVKHQRLRASGSWDIQDPTLRQESRRGLGLGRLKLRQNNTRAYLAAVVNEQSRQRREANWAPSFALDDVKLSEVAKRISKSDADYSINRAQRDYESVCKDMEAAKKLDESCEEENSMEQPEQEPNPPPSDSSEAGSPQNGFGMKRVPSVALVDREEEKCEDEDGASSVGSVGSSARAPDNTKGFGISKETLADLGLRATGRKDDSVCENMSRRTLSHNDIAGMAAMTLR